MFVVDIERFKALCALYFLNTIQPEELEELKAALNSGETELRKIFNQTKKAVKEAPLSGRFIDTYIDDSESYVKESKLKDVWTYSFARLFLSYWFSKVKIKIVVVLSLLLLVAFIILAYFTIQQSNELKEMRDEMSSQNTQLSKKDEMLSILQLKDAVVINLQGQSIDPAGFGRIVWSPAAHKAILQLAELPPAGKGKEYQLWLNKDTTYIKKDISTLDNDVSSNVISIEDIPSTKDNTNYTFMITLEKEGNNSKPAGVVYLIGR